MIKVYSWNGTGALRFLGTDSIENFEKILDRTELCGGTMTRDMFSIIGQENHVFYVYVVTD